MRSVLHGLGSLGQNIQQVLCEGAVDEDERHAADLVAAVRPRVIRAALHHDIARLQEHLAVVEDEVDLIPWDEMVKRLMTDNEKVLVSLEMAYEMAEKYGNHGLSNFLAERQASHKKYGWQLRSMIKDRVARFPNLSSLS